MNRLSRHRPWFSWPHRFRPGQSLWMFIIVRPVILMAAADWVSAAELAEQLDVRKGQIEDWLKRAVEDDIIEKKTRPVRYRRK